MIDVSVFFSAVVPQVAGFSSDRPHCLFYRSLVHPVFSTLSFYLPIEEVRTYEGVWSGLFTDRRGVKAMTYHTITTDLNVHLQAWAYQCSHTAGKNRTERREQSRIPNLGCSTGGRRTEFQRDTGDVVHCFFIRQRWCSVNFLVCSGRFDVILSF